MEEGSDGDVSDTGSVVEVGTGQKVSGKGKKIEKRKMEEEEEKGGKTKKGRKKKIETEGRDKEKGSESVSLASSPTIDSPLSERMFSPGKQDYGGQEYVGSENERNFEKVIQAGSLHK
ncbi:UNVERIFIED_CONTAM: hypothetical protein FKN15_017971 [Acipenser sinensis]